MLKGKARAFSSSIFVLPQRSQKINCFQDNTHSGHLPHAVACFAVFQPTEPNADVSPEFSGCSLIDHVAALHTAQLTLADVGFDAIGDFPQLHKLIQTSLILYVSAVMHHP